MEMEIGKPVDRHGKLRPVVHPEYVGHPVVGHIVYLPCGLYALVGQDCRRFETETEAVAYLERRWMS